MSLTAHDRLDLERIRRALTGAPAGPARMEAVIALDRIEQRLRELSGERPDDTKEIPIP